MLALKPNETVKTLFVENEEQYNWLFRMRVGIMIFTFSRTHDLNKINKRVTRVQKKRSRAQVLNKNRTGKKSYPDTGALSACA